ncbi:hypothetical protein LCGC14_2762410, partial [marine sediment metagenome]
MASEKIRQSKMKYQKSTKGRERHNEANARYKKTKKGKEANSRYSKSTKAKTTRKKYGRSKVKKESRVRYDKSTKGREAALKARHGSGAIECWNKFFEKQLGCCAICGRHQSELKQRLALDHDHETGEYRGLLCTR